MLLSHVGVCSRDRPNHNSHSHRESAHFSGPALDRRLTFKMALFLTKSAVHLVWLVIRKSSGMCKHTAKTRLDSCGRHLCRQQSQLVIHNKPLISYQCHCVQVSFYPWDSSGRKFALGAVHINAFFFAGSHNNWTLLVHFVVNVGISHAKNCSSDCIPLAFDGCWTATTPISAARCFKNVQPTGFRMW